MIVDVILPCLNEAALPRIFYRMPDGFRPIVAIAAPGTCGSSEGAGATVVHEPTPSGQPLTPACGGDQRPGALLRLRRTFDPRQFPLLTQPLAGGEADLVLGRRRTEERSAWPLPARVANWELARRVRRRTGLGIRDLGPMRAAGREALLSLNLADRRFGYPLEMVMNAAAAGWRVSEIEVKYLPRIGKSKVTGTVRGCMRTVHDMSQVLARQELSQVRAPRDQEPGR